MPIPGRRKPIQDGRCPFLSGETHFNGEVNQAPPQKKEPVKFFNRFLFHLANFYPAVFNCGDNGLCPGPVIGHSFFEVYYLHGF